MSLFAIVVVAAAGLVVRAFVDADDEGQCETAQEVEVAADPSIADAITQAASMYSTPDTCADVTVTAQESSQTKNELIDSSIDLWIPDSTMWRTRLADPNVVNSVGSIARTPLVAAAPRALAEGELGWPTEEFSWTGALESGAGTAIADPETTTEGLITLLTVRGALGEDAEMLQVVGAMTQVSRNVVPSVADAFEMVGTEDGPAVFTATEQAVVEHNRSNPDVAVAALYASEGTLALDYPALVVADSRASTAATEFAEYLSQNQDAVLAAGFRDRDNDLTAGQDDGVLSRAPNLLSTPDAAAIQAMTQQWAALSLDMRMLSVMDVSGSMDETNEEGVRRVDQTRDAAQNALALLPEGSSVGLWAFSAPEDQESGDPYTELVELGPLSDDVGDATRLEALFAASDSLPDRVDAGGTALYDTALAAFREVFADYDASKMNSVVMMTDGVNEDYAESIDLETLINSLEAQYDPAKPVALIMIGIGDDVDMRTLQQISQTTGASAYHAEDPSQIERVFLQAMIERQCRPNCSP